MYYAIEFLRIACIGRCNVRVVMKNNAFLVLQGDICALYWRACVLWIIREWARECL